MTGPLCALMNALGSPTVGEKSLRNFTPLMKTLEEEERR